MVIQSQASTSIISLVNYEHHILENDVVSLSQPSGEDIVIVPLFTEQDPGQVPIIGTIDETVEIEIENVLEVNENQEEILKPRKSNPKQWERNRIKLARDSGLAYTSLKGKEVKERTIGAGCTDSCKKKCHGSFTEDQRQHIFDNFWGLQSHVKQWGYIASYVRASPVQRRSVVIEEGTEPKRKFTYCYNLPFEGLDKAVCPNFFCGTLGVNRQWVRTAMKKKMRKGVVTPDKRGTNKVFSVVKAEIKENVIEHIRQFPLVESHYTRKRSKAKYLDENLNRRKMHSLYLLGRAGEDPEKTASLRQYRDVFNSEFRLKFFKPKKDQCNRMFVLQNSTGKNGTRIQKNGDTQHCKTGRVKIETGSYSFCYGAK